MVYGDHNAMNDPVKISWYWQRIYSNS